MPKVEIHDPAEVVVAPKPAPRAVNAVRHVTDERGRRIGWKKLSYMDQMRLAEITPANVTKNEFWNFLAMTAFSVVEIDGERSPKPATKLELNALIQRLGDEGMDAVMADARAAAPPAEADEPDDEIARGKE